MISFPPYVDSSMRTSYDACKRKHLWSVLYSLYPRGASVHLIAGAAIAAGLEHARKRVFLDPEPRSVTQAQMLEAAYTPFLLEWGDYRPDPDERSAKNFNTTWFALCHYLETHNPVEDEIQPWIRPDGSPAVEYKFAIPFEDILHPDTNEPILFVGRFDMIGVMQTPTGPLIGPSDEKSTGSLGFDWASKWDLRGQFLGYIWALRKQGIPASHAFVRGIAILKTKNETKTAIVNYPDHLLARWEYQFKSDVRSMIDRYKLFRDGQASDIDTHPFSFGDPCDSYGGCAFQLLCSAKHAEPFFSNFTSHRFNPLAVNPIEETAHD